MCSAVHHTKLVPEKFITEFESTVRKERCEMVTDDNEEILALRIICKKYVLSNMGDFHNATKSFLVRIGFCKITIAGINGKSKIYKK